MYVSRGCCSGPQPALRAFSGDAERELGEGALAGFRVPRGCDGRGGGAGGGRGEGPANSINPRHFDTIEGGRVCQALQKVS